MAPNKREPSHVIRRGTFNTSVVALISASSLNFSYPLLPSVLLSGSPFRLSSHHTSRPTVLHITMTSAPGPGPGPAADEQEIRSLNRKTLLEWLKQKLSLEP